MRNRWAMTMIAAPLMCAMVGIAGCRGNDGVDPHAQKPTTNAAEASQAQAQAQAMVTLTGCLDMTSPDQYRLQELRFEPRQAGDPQRDTTTPGPKGITEGSWVFLRAAEGTDLKSYAGQRVKISGAILDNGQNTIGTAGTPGTPGASGDSSQAASSEHHSDKVKAEAGRIARESMANGTAAEIRVQQVDSTGQRCVTRPDVKQ